MRRQIYVCDGCEKEIAKNEPILTLNLRTVNHNDGKEFHFHGLGCILPYIASIPNLRTISITVEEEV